MPDDVLVSGSGDCIDYGQERVKGKNRKNEKTIRKARISLVKG